MTRSEQKQVPGIYRRRVGDAVVTTINDGFLDIPLAILRGAPTERMEACMAEAFQPLAPRLTVNAFMIELGGRRILIDSGGGSTTIYSMGLLPENLKALGLTPDDFDTVLLTHIHPDHSNGLVGDNGEPLFPRAEVTVHQDDVTFWSDPALRDGRSAAAMPYLDSAAVFLKAYEGRIRTSEGGEVAPGITLLPLPGHTPGHSGYRLCSAGETLIIWGDTVHVPEIQVPFPAVTNEYDIKESLAAESRNRIFDMVARERLLVAGMHLHIPGFAHLVRGDGGYRLLPEAWAVKL
ncbi:MAG: MBL fold metallo-hydrolase [Proteobacteria bacterium]|nr:MBL fold metallo-hydrolase [Pseudomonadota bacterium]